MKSQNDYAATLPRISPEAAGLPGEAVEQFIARLSKLRLNPHSFMILRGGRVCAEACYAPYSPDRQQTIYSLSKSFTSAAVAMAVADGAIELDQRLVDLFPDDLPDKPSPELQALTLRHCLRMATGQPNEPNMARPHLVRAFLAMPFSEMPGQIFRYNTVATYMLSAALHTKGIDLEHYLQQRLFTPLGFSHIRWMRCPRGICAGGFGMSAYPELIAAFGQLLLQNGRWNDQQLIDPAYLELALSKQIETQSDDPSGKNNVGDWGLGYGYQFWQTRDQAYRGDGMFGQFCLVIPEKELVLAMTAFNDRLQDQLNVFFDTIVASLANSPLPENPAAQAKLARKLASLKISWPAAADDGSEIDDRFCNITYHFQTDLKPGLFTPPVFKTLQLRKTDSGLVLIGDQKHYALVNKASQLHQLTEYGLLRWPTQVLSSHGIVKRSRLNIRLFWLELLLKCEYQLQFSDEKVSLTIYDIHGTRPQKILHIEGLA